MTKNKNKKLTLSATQKCPLAEVPEVKVITVALRKLHTLSLVLFVLFLAFLSVKPSPELEEPHGLFLMQCSTRSRDSRFPGLYANDKLASPSFPNSWSLILAISNPEPIFVIQHLADLLP